MYDGNELVGNQKLKGRIRVELKLPEEGDSFTNGEAGSTLDLTSYNIKGAKAEYLRVELLVGR